MKRSTAITAAVLVVITIVIVAALMREATSGPVFRAEAHADYEACVAAIPAEWERGSLPRTGAEDACRYVHLRAPTP